MRRSKGEKGAPRVPSGGTAGAGTAAHSAHYVFNARVGRTRFMNGVGNTLGDAGTQRLSVPEHGPDGGMVAQELHPPYGLWRLRRPQYSSASEATTFLTWMMKTGSG